MNNILMPANFGNYQTITTNSGTPASNSAAVYQQQQQQYQPQQQQQQQQQLITSTPLLSSSFNNNNNNTKRSNSNTTKRNNLVSYFNNNNNNTNNFLQQQQQQQQQHIDLDFDLHYDDDNHDMGGCNLVSTTPHHPNTTHNTATTTTTTKHDSSIENVDEDECIELYTNDDLCHIEATIHNNNNNNKSHQHQQQNYLNNNNRVLTNNNNSTSSTNNNNKSYSSSSSSSFFSTSFSNYISPATTIDNFSQQQQQTQLISPTGGIRTPATRSTLKLQLMKQQVEQNEKKLSKSFQATHLIEQPQPQQQQQQQQQNTLNINLLNNNQINSNTSGDSNSISSSLPSTMPQVFQQIKLENPTAYHLSQQSKNKNFSSASDEQQEQLQQQQQQQHQAQQHAAQLQVQKSKDGNNNNNWDPITNSSTTDSPLSNALSEGNSEIDDYVPDDLPPSVAHSHSSRLTSMEIQEDSIENCLNLPKTLPTDDYFTVLSPSTPSSIRPSTSCPADIARLKQLQGLRLTDDEIKLIVKDRQKKDNHNMIERRRRFNINDRIKELGGLLPKGNQSSLSDLKQNKGSILKASVDYIKQLQTEVQRSKEIEDKLRQFSLINRKLNTRIKELEMQCKYQGMMSTTFAVQQQAGGSAMTPTTPNSAQLVQSLENGNSNTPNEMTLYQQQQQTSAIPTAATSNNTLPVKQEPILLDYNNLNQTHLLQFSPQNHIQQIQQQTQHLQQQQPQQQQQQQQHFQYFQTPTFNDSGLSLHDLNTFDDHLVSPIKQHDPLLSNCTIYSENLIDSFN